MLLRGLAGTSSARPSKACHTPIWGVAGGDTSSPTRRVSATGGGCRIWCARRWLRRHRRSAPALADYHRPGLLVEVEPGTKWACTNHGFAALGQIVEDVTGMAFDRYLRTQVFDPLGMDHTDLVRSSRVSPHLASGYVLGPMASPRSPTTPCRRQPAAARTPPQRTSRVTWPPCCRVAPTTTARSSSPRPWHRCSRPTTCLILGWQAWDWASSSARRVVTRPSARAASCPASCLRSSSRPTTGWASWPSGTPDVSTVAVCPSRSRRRCCAASPHSPKTPSAPTSRRTLRAGTSSAAGTGLSRARSRTCSPERCSAPGSRWLCGEAAWCSSH